jgi:protein required for attachment to host cells
MRFSLFQINLLWRILDLNLTIKIGVIMKPVWILVADGSKALIFLFKGPKIPFELLDNGKFEHTNEPTRELVTNKRGRTKQSFSSARSAMESPTDPHEHEKFVFSRELASFLYDNIKEYDKLIISAPPKTLGNLREVLHDNVKAKIKGELDKDLTNIPTDKIAQHFTDFLNINDEPKGFDRDLKYGTK